MAENNRLTIILAPHQYKQLEQLSAMHNVPKGQIIRKAAYDMFKEYFDYKKTHSAIESIDRSLAVFELGCQDFDPTETIEQMSEAARESTRQMDLFAKSLKDADADKKALNN